MNKEELKLLIDRMNLIYDKVPRALSNLKDALTFASLDLISCWKYGIKGKDFDKALSFAKSIPPFTDYESDEFNHWLIHDQEYIKYWPPY